MKKISQNVRLTLACIGIVLLLCGVALAVRAQRVVSLPQQLHILAASAGNITQPTKMRECSARDSMPDPACTPGAVFVGTTREEICTSGYSKKVRKVSQGLKDQVYTAYGIKNRKAGEYQVDHHISLELGGSNEFSNLWPQAAEPKPGFHEKDEVENFLHKALCEGELSVREVQILISKQWKDVFELLHDSGQVWHTNEEE